MMRKTGKTPLQETPFQKRMAELIEARKIVLPETLPSYWAQLGEVGTHEFAAIAKATGNWSGVERLYFIDAKPAALYPGHVKMMFPGSLDFRGLAIQSPRLSGAYAMLGLHGFSKEYQVALFRRTYGALANGGNFVYGDWFAEVDSETQKITVEGHFDRLQKQLPCKIPQRLPPEMAMNWWLGEYGLQREGIFMIKEVLRILRGMGFRAEVAFYEGLEGIILARK